MANVSREVYLRTLYRPDLDWLNGALGERHLGDYEHSTVVGSLMFALGQREDELRARVLPSLRLQVSAERYRVTDLCLIERSAQWESIPTRPPLLCVEVLSPGDRMTYVLEMFEDLLSMGVQELWMLDPRRRMAWVIDAGGVQRRADQLTVPGTSVTLSRNEIFKQLDERMGHLG